MGHPFTPLRKCDSYVGQSECIVFVAFLRMRNRLGREGELAQEDVIAFIHAQHI